MGDDRNEPGSPTRSGRLEHGSAAAAGTLHADRPGDGAVASTGLTTASAPPATPQEVAAA